VLETPRIEGTAGGTENSVFSSPLTTPTSAGPGQKSEAGTAKAAKPAKKSSKVK